METFDHTCDKAYWTMIKEFLKIYWDKMGLEERGNKDWKELSKKTCKSSVHEALISFLKVFENPYTEVRSVSNFFETFRMS